MEGHAVGAGGLGQQQRAPPPRDPGVTGRRQGHQVGADVGLLAEGYDTVRGCQAGNFPQAFSHVGLINSALNLSRMRAPAAERSES